MSKIGVELLDEDRMVYSKPDAHRKPAPYRHKRPEVKDKLGEAMASRHRMIEQLEHMAFTTGK